MTDIADVQRPARRDFITLAAGAFAGVGASLALWPFIDQMNPNGSSPAADRSEIDLRPIESGQVVTVMWKGMPVFIRHRTSAEMQLARNATLGDLPDRFARNEALPQSALASDANRTKAGFESWLVVIGLCTHLGCRLNHQTAAETLATGEGWFCPCHAARFDISGRVRSGPARTNLPVPPYRFLTPTKIEIGWKDYAAAG